MTNSSAVASTRVRCARRGRRESLAERDRAPRARGRELDDPKAVERVDVVVEPPTQASVELLRSVDVGHGDDVDLEVHLDRPDGRVAARVVCFGGTRRGHHQEDRWVDISYMLTGT